MTLLAAHNTELQYSFRTYIVPCYLLFRPIDRHLITVSLLPIQNRQYTVH
jgi:hypothetical protein